MRLGVVWLSLALCGCGSTVNTGGTGGGGGGGGDGGSGALDLSASVDAAGCTSSAQCCVLAESFNH